MADKTITKDYDSGGTSRALLKFCRDLFKTSNLIGSDFKDVSVLQVERPFEQDKAGLHVQFTVSWILSTYGAKVGPVRDRRESVNLP